MNEPRWKVGDKVHWNGRSVIPPAPPQDVEIATVREGARNTRLDGIAIYSFLYHRDDPAVSCAADFVFGEDLSLVVAERAEEADDDGD